ncbi:hypothetical protein A3844_28860 [Paenibacillus helianthi]|uniref:AMP-dependent synthetase and ligase n=1 Tax=Paenibacillus helianthi TaxID=1349432 RepID=A0ABX3EEU2_9BACL|nr:hypothetical protein A3844_28860 [Paenibacillus helianthi]
MPRRQKILNSNISSQINQCEQIIQQLVSQTQQASQNYQQLLQQEQQNAAKLEELADRERKASQMIQQALQGHQTAVQQLQHVSQLVRQMEQNSQISSFSTGIGTGAQGFNPSYSPVFHSSMNQQPSQVPHIPMMPSFNSQQMHSPMSPNQSFGSSMNQGRSFQ